MKGDAATYRGLGGRWQVGMATPFKRPFSGVLLGCVHHSIYPPSKTSKTWSWRKTYLIVRALRNNKVGQPSIMMTGIKMNN